MSATPSISDIYNFRQVSPDLASSGQPREHQLAAIAEAGYNVIINLALHNDPRYSLPDEAASVRALGLDYVHIPVQFGAPMESDLEKFFAAMDQHASKRIWVHCAANMRVSAFLGLYRTLRQGWPEAQAFALMHEIWQPDPVWSKFIASQLANAHGVNSPILQSALTCPRCGFVAIETMPVDACIFFYECTNCHTMLRPEQGDCCVFCSFGSVQCPSIQQSVVCCAGAASSAKS